MVHTPNPDLRFAVDKFVGWSERLLAARTWATTMPLFHYTSLDAFESIVTSGELWLTRLLAQKNDDSEFNYGLELFTAMVEENAKHAEPSPIHKAFFNRLRMVDASLVDRHYDCHIICFAPHGEDFDLWERHGRNGEGVAIGVSPKFFSISDPRPEEPPTFVQPVTYGEAGPLHEMRKIFQVASMALGEAAPHVRNADDHKYVDRALYEQIVAGHVLPMCMLAKQPDFVLETEVRMLAPKVRRSDDEERPNHVAVPLSTDMIDMVLAGEKSDLERVRGIASKVGIDTAKVRAASYSKGLPKGM